MGKIGSQRHIARLFPSLASGIVPSPSLNSRTSPLLQHHSLTIVFKEYCIFLSPDIAIKVGHRPQLFLFFPLGYCSYFLMAGSWSGCVCYAGVDVIFANTVTELS